MATAPKCKVCGGAHWSGQPHVGMAAARPAARPQVLPRITLVADDRDVVIVGLRAEVGALKDQVARLEADAAVTAKRREANRDRMKRVRSK